MHFYVSCHGDADGLVPILAELPGRASEVFPSTGHGREMPWNNIFWLQLTAPQVIDMSWSTEFAHLTASSFVICTSVPQEHELLKKTSVDFHQNLLQQWAKEVQWNEIHDMCGTIVAFQLLVYKSIPWFGIVSLKAITSWIQRGEWNIDELCKPAANHCCKALFNSLEALVIRLTTGEHCSVPESDVHWQVLRLRVAAQVQSYEAKGLKPWHESAKNR